MLPAYVFFLKNEVPGSKSSLKKFQWRRKRREWSAERGDERGDNWRGSDAFGNDPDFSGGKYRRGGEYAKLWSMQQGDEHLDGVDE